MAKLGTEKNPAIVHVQTEERIEEIASIFEKHGWTYIIGFEPGKPEDISDLERLLNPPTPRQVDKKTGRNEPCPCGSGKKYKKCCAANAHSPHDGLTAGIRMKGGVCFDEQADVYVPIVHTWHNVQCNGEPTEWRSPKVFRTEEEAMNYYKLYIRPDLQRMMSKMENELSDGTFVHRKLE